MNMQILLPADGSEHSVRAAEKAIEVAKMFKGRIDVLYVVDGATSKSDVLQNVSKFEIERKRKARLQPIEDRIIHAGLDYSIIIEHGEPGPTIVEFANRGNYECVVVGSRGLNKLQTMVLGSVSHKVVKRVECPVMVIK
ncbi:MULTISPECIES: universal stress protein [Bacillaceae]|uniref:universal stress protein n=1 Tax=Bacillaceae TaxID=186817 RepID=UPI000C7915A2|nr:universal stress protein [Metabacillus halosaccharovorans]PLR67358.1 universal stress protein [Bacillus sp. UMB0893]PMC35039.1 universal stress protein [Bacillus sp. UMB0899]